MSLLVARKSTTLVVLVKSCMPLLVLILHCMVWLFNHHFLEVISFFHIVLMWYFENWQVNRIQKKYVWETFLHISFMRCSYSISNVLVHERTLEITVINNSIDNFSINFWEVDENNTLCCTFCIFSIGKLLSDWHLIMRILTG